MAEDQQRNVGVVGAESLLGREILLELESRHEVVRVVPLSERSAGNEVPFRGRDLLIEELDEDLLEAPPGMVLFATGSGRSLRWARKLVEAGTRVVDCSSAFRLDPKVPLLGLSPPTSSRLSAVPGSAPLAAARVLAPLLGILGEGRLTATLLVPVSASGQKGVLELSHQTAALLAGRNVRRRRFPHRVAFNVIPEVGGFVEGDDTGLERSFREELRRLLGRPQLAVAVTAVRVPLFFGLSLVLAILPDEPHAPQSVRSALTGSPGIKVLDGAGAYPMPSLAVGDPSILVGRIRGDGAGGLELFASTDSLRLAASVAVRGALQLDHL